LSVRKKTKKVFKMENNIEEIFMFARKMYVKFYGFKRYNNEICLGSYSSKDTYDNFNFEGIALEGYVE
jgi:hypothetical protein